MTALLTVKIRHDVSAHPAVGHATIIVGPVGTLFIAATAHAHDANVVHARPPSAAG
jgi:hypothetical protein